jgi:hypothetical protein
VVGEHRWLNAVDERAELCDGFLGFALQSRSK